MRVAAMAVALALPSLGREWYRTTVQRIEPDLSPVAGAAAISLVERLTRESWTAANLPFPSYLRAQTPVRFVPERLT
jgi:hypothetical protein